MTRDVDISEFVRGCREQLLKAFEAAGVPLSELREYSSKRAPFGSWKRPVFFVLNEKPIAKCWISFPVKDGKKTARFNLETFESVNQWLNLTNKSSIQQEVP